MKFRVYDKQEKKYVKGLFLDENGRLCTLRRIDFDIFEVHGKQERRD